VNSAKPAAASLSDVSVSNGAFWPIRGSERNDLSTAAVEDAEKLLLNSTISPGFQGLAPLFFLAKWHGDLT